MRLATFVLLSIFLSLIGCGSVSGNVAAKYDCGSEARPTFNPNQTQETLTIFLNLAITTPKT